MWTNTFNVVYCFQLAFTECHYPRAFMWWIGGHAVMFFFLFSEFYIKAYLRSTKKVSEHTILVPDSVLIHKNYCKYSETDVYSLFYCYGTLNTLCHYITILTDLAVIDVKWFSLLSITLLTSPECLGKKSKLVSVKLL